MLIVVRLTDSLKVIKKLGGALFLLWALMACASSAAQQAAFTQKVRVSIDPDSMPTPIADDFIGFGYESSAVARGGYFSPENIHLVQLYRTLWPHGLVRIGGNVSDHTRFVSDGASQVQSEKGTTVINQKVLQEFGDFLRATGWKAMWGLNLGSGSKEEAVQEALAVHRALGDRLQSLEIGNEVDLLPRFKAYDSYYGMLAFAVAGKGEMVKLTSSPSDANLTTYATRSVAGSLWVTAVNKDLSRQVTLELVLPAGRSRAEAYRLEAPSIESRDQVTLAGAQVSAQGTWSPGPAEKIKVSEAVASLPVPVASAVLVRLF